MLSAISGSHRAAPEPQNTFLLVQEIVDEENYLRLTNNLESMHTLCVGGSDKVRLIFSQEPPATVSEKVFQGVAQHSRAVLLLLSNCGFSPATISTPTSSVTATLR
jgi:hypothetical protein